MRATNSALGRAGIDHFGHIAGLTGCFAIRKLYRSSEIGIQRGVTAFDVGQGTVRWLPSKIALDGPALVRRGDMSSHQQKRRHLRFARW